VNIINAGYDSANYYLLETQRGKLMVDCGWPGTLPRLNAVLKRKGSALSELRYLVVTHFHPDHAGLTQELKNRGVKLVLLESQRPFIAPLNEFFQTKDYPYVEIQEKDNLHLEFEQSRVFLAGLGVPGEILSTPGHSDDSITLILDEGFAFTGDLHPRFMLPEDDHLNRESWDRIYRHQITQIYPGHGG